MVSIRGGSRIFLRGDFKKNVDLFLTKLVFRELFEALKKSLFWPKFLRRMQNLEKTGQKGVFGHFLARAPPLKLVYIGAFRKILGSVSQNWISQNSSKGDPLGR